jgi:hypothetical protein
VKKVLFIFLMLFASFSFAQEERKLVQFSGVVLHADSALPVSYVNVINISRGHRGTITDFKGFFSLVVGTGDTIQLTAIGYKKLQVIIPQDYKLNNYTVTFRMEMSAVNLPLVFIFPWPTVEQFKRAFVEVKIPDDDMVRAKRNLDQKVMTQIGNTMAWDGKQNSRNYFAQQSEKLYWAGQTRPNPLLDVVKIAQFMKLLNEGKVSLRNEKRED